jgi:hypothetical protein
MYLRGEEVGGDPAKVAELFTRGRPSNPAFCYNLAGL